MSIGESKQFAYYEKYKIHIQNIKKIDKQISLLDKILDKASKLKENRFEENFEYLNVLFDIEESGIETYLEDLAGKKNPIESLFSRDNDDSPDEFSFKYNNLTSNKNNSILNDSNYLDGSSFFDDTGTYLSKDTSKNLFRSRKAKNPLDKQQKSLKKDEESSFSLHSTLPKQSHERMTLPKGLRSTNDRMKVETKIIETNENLEDNDFKLDPNLLGKIQDDDGSITFRSKDESLSREVSKSNLPIVSSVENEGSTFQKKFTVPHGTHLVNEQNKKFKADSNPFSRKNPNRSVVANEEVKLDKTSGFAKGLNNFTILKESKDKYFTPIISNANQEIVDKSNNSNSIDDKLKNLVKFSSNTNEDNIQKETSLLDLLNIGLRGGMILFSGDFKVAEAYRTFIDKKCNI